MLIKTLEELKEYDNGDYFPQDLITSVLSDLDDVRLLIFRLLAEHGTSVGRSKGRNLKNAKSSGLSQNLPYESSVFISGITIESISFRSRS